MMVMFSKYSIYCDPESPEFLLFSIGLQTKQQLSSLNMILVMASNPTRFRKPKIRKAILAYSGSGGGTGTSFVNYFKSLQNTGMQ